MVLRDRGVVDDLDALGGERPAGRRSRSALSSATSSRTRLRAATSCSPAVRPSGDVVVEPAWSCWRRPDDPDLEELVEHAREDRQEVDPLEQRVAGVARLVQDAAGVVEPGQLAVDVRARRRGGFRAGRAACRGRSRCRRPRRRRSSGGSGSCEDVTGSAGRSGEADSWPRENSTRPRPGNGTDAGRAWLASLMPLSPPRRSAARRSAGRRRRASAGRVVGSTNTSSVGRKRGSSVPAGSPPPGPIGVERAVGRLRAVALPLDRRATIRIAAPRPSSQSPAEPGAERRPRSGRRAPSAAPRTPSDDPDRRGEHACSARRRLLGGGLGAAASGSTTTAVP